MVTIVPHGNSARDNDKTGSTEKGWNWDHVGPYFSLTSFIILTAIVIIGFHHVPKLAEWLPESCLLIISGVVVGFILKPLQLLPVHEIETGNCITRAHNVQTHHNWTDTSDNDGYNFPIFTPELFFFVLLPPVIMDASYSLYDLDFASNIGTILLYAVLGTVMNTFIIGPFLYLLYWSGAMGMLALVAGKKYQLLMTDALVFSSLISAVDPVAVLAIFQETHIDRMIYFLVFGESLLNDAVTVGLYHTMIHFATDSSLNTRRLLVSCLRLMAVGVVGLFIGIIYGLLTALLTLTTARVRVLEPLVVMGMAFMAYVTAELFEFSGIISLIGCGLVQAHYAMRNISKKSYTTVKYSTKMASAISEAIIFLFLGMALLTADHLLHWSFIMWTLILCIGCRFLAVFLCSWLANKYRARTIKREEQFIMAYGGLRGAVCFSLVKMLDPCIVQPRNLFLTTSLVIIFLTVFVQGTTIKPMMQIFHIKKSEDDGDFLLIDVNHTVNELILAAMEEIIGVTGTFSLKNKICQWDEKYLQKWFLREAKEPEFLRTFRKHAILDVQLGRVPPSSNIHSTENLRSKPQVTFTTEEHQKLRQTLTKHRPITMYRFQLDEEIDSVEESANLQLRRASQIAKRLQRAASRQSRFPTQMSDNVVSIGTDDTL